MPLICELRQIFCSFIPLHLLWIPFPPEADLNTLYVERSRYLPHLQVLIEVIRQFDAISVDNLDVHRLILLITQEQVLRRLQVEKACTNLTRRSPNTPIIARILSVGLLNLKQKKMPKL
jgi:hypothetical protein